MLYTCKDCGHQVSDTARCCPQCGAVNYYNMYRKQEYEEKVAEQQYRQVGINDSLRKAAISLLVATICWIAVYVVVSKAIEKGNDWEMTLLSCLGAIFVIRLCLWARSFLGGMVLFFVIFGIVALLEEAAGRFSHGIDNILFGTVVLFCVYTIAIRPIWQFGKAVWHWWKLNKIEYTDDDKLEAFLENEYKS